MACRHNLRGQGGMGTREIWEILTHAIVEKKSHILRIKDHRTLEAQDYIIPGHRILES